MAWLDDYQQASFRGVEFYVPSHEGKGGHRIQVTEFPGRDVADTQQFGKKPKSFSLECYVIGDDYNEQRDLLIQALDKRGNGRLVHPYLGSLQCLIVDYTWRDSVRELGMARFSINVIEAGELKFPINVVDTKSNVAIKKAEALQAVQDDFADRYTLRGRVITFATSTQNAINKSFDVIEENKRTVSSEASYRRDLENIRGKLIALSYDGLELIENMTDLISFGLDADDDFEATPDNARNSYEDMKPLTIFSADESITLDETDPTIVFQEAIKLISIINQGAILSFINFESANEAEEIRASVFANIDAFMESTNNDDVYDALYDLRTAITEDIDDRIRNLPKLVNYTPITTLPAIVISHDLYGNIDKEQEIIERNRVVHPAFVPGLVPLEVLLNAD